MEMQRESRISTRTYVYGVYVSELPILEKKMVSLDPQDEEVLERIGWCETTFTVSPWDECVCYVVLHFMISILFSLFF